MQGRSRKATYRMTTAATMRAISATPATTVPAMAPDDAEPDAAISKQVSADKQATKLSQHAPSASPSTIWPDASTQRHSSQPASFWIVMDWAPGLQLRTSSELDVNGHWSGVLVSPALAGGGAVGVGAVGGGRSRGRRLASGDRAIRLGDKWQ